MEYYYEDVSFFSLSSGACSYIACVMQPYGHTRLYDSEGRQFAV
jgi:hypothetical protein